jgi:hypothetical protein
VSATRVWVATLENILYGFNYLDSLAKSFFPVSLFPLQAVQFSVAGSDLHRLSYLLLLYAQSADIHILASRGMSGAAEMASH